MAPWSRCVRAQTVAREVADAVRFIWNAEFASTLVCGAHLVGKDGTPCGGLLPRRTHDIGGASKLKYESMLLCRANVLQVALCRC